MTLKLKGTESKKIALRHYANRMNVLIDNIQIASDNLTLKYIRLQTNKMLAEVRKVRDNFISLNIEVSHMDMEQVVEEIVENEILYKRQAMSYISKLRSYAQSLKYRKDKFNDLITAILELAQVSAVNFIDASEDSKNTKIAELGEGVPTFAQIASVLRVAELQNARVVSETLRHLSVHANKLTEKINESGLDEIDLNREFANILEIAEVEVYEMSFTILSNLFENNDDRDIFLNKTLRLTTANFFNRNHSRFMNALRENISL